MYATIEIEELLQFNEMGSVKNFVIAKDYNREQLIDLSTKLISNNDKLKEVYWLDGADSIYYPSFKSIKLPPRIVLKGKEMRFQNDGLIFPQTNPIILVIANFHKLDKEDQEQYLRQICKKESSDYYPHNYLHDNSIVILGFSSSVEEPKISYKLEVRVLL